MHPKKSEPIVDMTSQVFKLFLEQAAELKVDKEVIDRLKTTLLTEKDFSEEALETAMFGNGSND